MAAPAHTAHWPRGTSLGMLSLLGFSRLSFLSKACSGTHGRMGQCPSGQSSCLAVPRSLWPPPGVTSKSYSHSPSLVKKHLAATPSSGSSYLPQVQAGNPNATIQGALPAPPGPQWSPHGLRGITRPPPPQHLTEEKPPPQHYSHIGAAGSAPSIYPSVPSRLGLEWIKIFS